MAAPGFVAPMLATLSDERALGEGWLLERKLDGVRCIAVAAAGRVSLFTRAENDVTARWPAVARAVAALGRDVVLDGEVVAMDGDEPQGFQALQRGAGAVALWTFDVLHLDGADLRSRPLRERREILAGLLEDAARALRHTEAWEGASEDRYVRACAAGWEGLIAKVAGGPYVGGRSRDWLKLKCLAEQEVVVGGWTEPRGSRTGLGALLVGVYAGSALRYAGKVGTGFDRRTLRDLVERLRPLERDSSPFAEPIRPAVAGPHWAEPRLVAQVAFQEWTGAGRLRQPRFLGLRDDKAPEDVVRETPG
ncbi:MAG: DNA_ligase_IV_Ku-like [uncultured Solirubrobacteraceae bacterium]|uniref:DNA ligase (ATP) n=1 Tax=uncultured Solirubrobacteraceae bacterium TaxID=1162706 RepID=A0A6J4T0F0_9ACTN|nr:MAG: DNA_ligase_IV_Ku-like [uncultured Solirubrobacteraceae bacterium]